MYLLALILMILAVLVFVLFDGGGRIFGRPFPALGLALLAGALICQFVHIWGNPILLNH